MYFCSWLPTLEKIVYDSLTAGDISDDFRYNFKPYVHLFSFLCDNGKVKIFFFIFCNVCVCVCLCKIMAD